jgi:hypothetical protein
MIHLHDLGGLWRRRLIAWPDGRTDTTTEVIWLQAPRRYADLRIPIGRPMSAHIACLRDLDWTMLRFMARQEGFFGELAVSDSVGNWCRVFDYQPDTGAADCGALAFDGDILVERGVEQPYTELWSRAGTGDAMAIALATDTGAAGCLVAAGDAFMYARGRAAPLPHGATLRELMDKAASLHAAQDIIDCEISFGRRRGGDWRIERSSHGFREGATLAPELDEMAGRLIVDDLTAEGAPFRRAWRISGQESSGDAPLSQWFIEGRRSAPTEPVDRTPVEKLGAPV